MSNIIQQLDDMTRRLVAQLDADPVFGALLAGRSNVRHLIGIYDQIRHGAAQVPTHFRVAAESIRLYGSADPRFANARYERFKTPLYQEFADEIVRHAGEESGHDQWLADDLRALGVSNYELATSTPLPAAAAYLTQFRAAAVGPCPIGVWGIAYVLEGLGETIAGPIADNLRKFSGIANVDNAVSFFARHGEADVGHMEAARARLRRVASSEDLDAILFQARATLETWGRMGHDVARTNP